MAAATASAAMMAEAGKWTSPQLPVKGQDALDMGVAPGRRVGAIIAAVEAWWIDGDFSATRAQCLARMKKLAD